MGVRKSHTQMSPISYIALRGGDKATQKKDIKLAKHIAGELEE